MSWFQIVTNWFVKILQMIMKVDLRTEHERALDERDAKIKKRYARIAQETDASDRRIFMQLAKEFDLCSVHIRRIIVNGDRQH